MANATRAGLRSPKAYSQPQVSVAFKFPIFIQKIAGFGRHKSRASQCLRVDLYFLKQYSEVVWQVRWSRKVQKQLDDLPEYIVGSFYDWAKAVEKDGMESIRKLAGYHDEKLRGELAGLRSVRISKAHRVFYFESADGSIKVAEVTKVSKHEYKK